MAGSNHKPERQEGDSPLPFAKRIGWFILLWCLGLSVIGVISYSIRAVIL